MFSGLSEIGLILTRYIPVGILGAQNLHLLLESVVCVDIVLLSLLIACVSYAALELLIFTVFVCLSSQERNHLPAGLIP